MAIPLNNNNVAFVPLEYAQQMAQRRRQQILMAQAAHPIQNPPPLQRTEIQAQMKERDRATREALRKIQASYKRTQKELKQSQEKLRQLALLQQGTPKERAAVTTFFQLPQHLNKVLNSINPVDTNTQEALVRFRETLNEHFEDWKDKFRTFIGKNGSAKNFLANGSTYKNTLIAQFYDANGLRFMKDIHSAINSSNIDDNCPNLAMRLFHSLTHAIRSFISKVRGEDAPAPNFALTGYQRILRQKMERALTATKAGATPTV